VVLEAMTGSTRWMNHWLDTKCHPHRWSFGLLDKTLCCPVRSLFSSSLREKTFRGFRLQRKYNQNKKLKKSIKFFEAGKKYIHKLQLI
jgi:hypothetical protein